MLGRVAACGAGAAIMLSAVVFPGHSSAKGFAAAPAYHAGSFRAAPARYWHSQPLRRYGHPYGPRSRFGYGQGHGYGYGYAYLPLGYGFDNYAPQEIVVPVAYPVSIVPRCIHSVETVIVPAELGGERKIRITRC